MKEQWRAGAFRACFFPYKNSSSRRQSYKWKTNLEMRGLLLEIADDLCYGCRIFDGEDYMDENWIRKYCEGHARLTT